MRLLLNGAGSDLSEDEAKKTLRSGKLLSSISLVLIGAFCIYALAGPLGVPYLPWSLAGFVPSFLFLTVGSELYASRSSLILPFHAVSLIGVQVMAMGIVSTFLLSPDPSVGVWITVVAVPVVGALLVSLFAAGARGYLWAILLLPPLAFSVYIVLERTVGELAILQLSSVWIVAIVCAVLTFVHDRTIRAERSARARVEVRGLDLQKELGTLKERNEELERKVARMAKEIEERKAVEAVLEQRASIDDLTGVFNRRAGLEILKQSIFLTERYAQPLSLCFIDIDDLKTVNDNWGHAAGDELIRRIITVLKKHFRKSDYISRLGGDEFLAILTNCTAEAAGVILDRIKSDLAEQSGQEKRFPIAISYGLAERDPTSDLTAEELLRLADNNMYRNKQQKRVKPPEE